MEFSRRIPALRVHAPRGNRARELNLFTAIHQKGFHIDMGSVPGLSCSILPIQLRYTTESLRTLRGGKMLNEAVGDSSNIYKQAYLMFQDNCTHLTAPHSLYIVITPPFTMHLSFLLALAPAAVLACLNENTNPCASFIKSQAATASPFCASYTRTVNTATTGLPAWAANCSNKPKLISAECSCHYTGGGSPVTTTSPVRTTAPATTTAGQVTTTRPSTPTTSAGGGNSGSCSAPVCVYLEPKMRRLTCARSTLWSVMVVRLLVEAAVQVSL